MIGNDPTPWHLIRRGTEAEKKVTVRRSDLAQFRPEQGYCILTAENGDQFLARHWETPELEGIRVIAKIVEDTVQ